MDERDETGPEERRLTDLVDQVTAPSGRRRWRIDATAGSGGARFARQHRRAPLIAAAGLVVAVAAAGALAGTGRLGPGHSNGAAGSGFAGPSPRGGAAMAWDDATHSVILFGGRSATGNQSDTWSWDGTSWHQLFPATSPPARSGAVMAKDGHGGLVLVGGMGDTGGRSNAPNCVPPALPPLPSGLAKPTPAPVPQGSITLCAAPLSELSDTWTWDGRTWTRQHPGHAPRGTAAAAAFDSGSGSAVVLVHVISAVAAQSGTACVVSPPVHPTGVSPAPLPSPAASCKPVPVTQQPVPPTPQLWRWSGSDWVSVAGPSNGAALVELAADPAGGLLALGAATPVIPPIPREVGTNPPLPCAPGTTPPGDACPLVSGPAVSVGPPVSLQPSVAFTTLHLDNGATWRDLGASSAPLFNGAPLVGDPNNHQVVAPGGVETEVWDGRSWSGVAQLTGPVRRGGIAAAYDEANRQVVVFGGATPGGLAGDTWIWDGSRWTREAGTTPSQPPLPGVGTGVGVPQPVIGSAVPAPAARVTPG